MYREHCGEFVCGYWGLMGVMTLVLLLLLTHSTSVGLLLLRELYLQSFSTLALKNQKLAPIKK